MTSVLSLSADQVSSVVSMTELIKVVERGLGNFSKGPEGGVVQPVRSVVMVNKPDGGEQDGFFGVMPAYSATDEALACKLVSFFPGNVKHGKPTHLANILLYDPKYGELKAIMDGEVLTGMRTAAASAVASKHLVDGEGKELKLAILGAGVQARTHFQALKTLFTFSEVRIWSRTMESAFKCAEDVGGEACLSTEEAVNDADIIITVTSSPTPVLQKSWVKPGAHVNAVGACRSDWHEIDPELMRTAQVYVDSREAAMKESGDVILSKCDIHAEIGEVVIGKVEPTKDPSTITIFKSLGLGIEDAVSAKLVYDSYMAQNADI